MPESGNQALFPEYGKWGEKLLQREVLCRLPESLLQKKQGKHLSEAAGHLVRMRLLALAGHTVALPFACFDFVLSVSSCHA